MYCLQVYKMNVSKMGSVIELLLLHGLVHGAVLVAPLHISSSSAVRYLVYPAVERSVLLYIWSTLGRPIPRATTATTCMAESRTFHCWPLHLEWAPLGSPPPAYKNNENAFCKLLKPVAYNLFRRGWAGAPLSRFLEGAPYKFLNEWMNDYRL